MIVVASDFHIPYHDDVMLSLFYKFLRKNNVDRLIINGDFIDFYSISKFDKDPKRITHLQRDVDMAQEILKKLSKLVGEIHYVVGNHEERLQKYLWSKAPELSSLRSLRLERLLDFKKFDVVKHEKGLKVSSFWVTHGDVARKHSAYTAKAMFEKYGRSVISGHTHRGGSFYITLMGKMFQAHECFCMCDLNPDYINWANWMHGWLIIEDDKVHQVLP